MGKTPRSKTDELHETIIHCLWMAKELYSESTEGIILRFYLIKSSKILNEIRLNELKGVDLKKGNHEK